MEDAVWGKRIIPGLLIVILPLGCRKQEIILPERVAPVRGSFTLGEDLKQHTDPRVGGDLDPSLSPDGVHLGFASRRDGPHHNIYQKNLHRSEVARITAFSAHDRFPEYSPDGRWRMVAHGR